MVISSSSASFSYSPTHKFRHNVKDMIGCSGYVARDYTSPQRLSGTTTISRKTRKKAPAELFALEFFLSLQLLAQRIAFKAHTQNIPNGIFSSSQERQWLWEKVPGHPDLLIGQALRKRAAIEAIR